MIYLALAPKSNAAYRAFGAAMAAAERTGSLTPPKHILNAPTRLMKSEGYGAGYVYDHDTEAGFSGQDYFPPGMGRERFYEPGDRGFERELRERLLSFAAERASKEKSEPERVAGPAPTRAEQEADHRNRQTRARPGADRLRQLRPRRPERGDLDAIAAVLARPQRSRRPDRAAAASGESFYGVLEGPRRRVFQRMEAIIADRRHARLAHPPRGADRPRRFENWSFGLLPVGRATGRRAPRGVHLELRPTPGIRRRIG